MTQHRVREKQFLAGAGIPVAPFAVVQDAADLERGLARLGTPADPQDGRLRLRRQGAGPDRRPAGGRGGVGGDRRPTRPCSKACVDFACEVSVVVARGVDGAVADYGAIENSHRHHILDVSVWPARVSEETARKAVTLARRACEALDVVGVLCVEFFVTRDGRAASSTNWRRARTTPGT